MLFICLFSKWVTLFKLRSYKNIHKRSTNVHLKFVKSKK